MTPTLLWGLAVVLVVGGVIGTVLPIIPGPVLVFCGLLLGAWIDGFDRVGGLAVTGMGLLALFTFAIDLTSASFGSRSAKASGWAVAGAAIGTVVGLFFGLVGVFVAPFVGAVAGEYWAERDLHRAGKVGFSAWLGMILGGALKLAVVFLMVGWFVAAFFL